MKKLISILAIIAILFASLFTLTGCGDEEESSSKKKKSEDKEIVNEKDDDEDEDKDDDEDKDEEDSKKTSSTKKEKVDIKGKSSYYFVVNGKKYTTENKVKDIEASGYKQDSTAAETDVPTKTYLIGGGYFRNAKGSTVFSVMPLNTTSDKIKCAEANIGGFTLDDYYFENIDGTVEVAGGITIGSSVEDVEAVFGEPTEKDMREDYENLGILYTYKSSTYKYFEFEIDKEKKTVIEITWRYFDL